MKKIEHEKNIPQGLNTTILADEIQRGRAVWSAR